MNSKVAGEARRAQLEDLRRTSGEQRLLAFVNHNRLVAEIRAAGERMRLQARASALAECATRVESET